jgi:hypothetical protein
MGIFSRGGGRWLRSSVTSETGVNRAFDFTADGGTTDEHALKIIANTIR